MAGKTEIGEPGKGTARRRYGVFLIIAGAFMAVAGCTTIVQETRPAPPGEIQIVTSECRSEGHRKAIIEGTVQNGTASPVYNVYVRGEIIGPQGRSWGQGTDRIERLNAHESKHFKIKIDDVPTGQIQNHRVWLELNRSSDRHEGHDGDSDQD